MTLSFNNILLFIFVFLVGMLFIYLDILKKKADFRASLEQKDREERWRVEYYANKHKKTLDKNVGYDENKYYRDLDKLKNNIVPTWTVDIIQSLDSKVFIKLLKGYFEAKGFVIRYISNDKNMEDVFVICKSNRTASHSIIKCRTIGCDLVSLDTVKILCNLSKQYSLTNLTIVTTGKFSNEVSTLLKNRKGFNLIDVNRLISLLMMLPIEKQIDLFAEALIDKE